MQVINATLPMLKCKKLVIGFEGENQRTQVRIDASPIFAEYPSATPSLTVRPVLSAAYPVLVERDEDEVVWDIVAGNLAINGDAEMQLTFQMGDVICKTCIGKIHVKRSLGVSGEMPDPVVQWVNAATAKLNEVDAQIDELEDMVDAAEAARDTAQSVVDGATASIQTAGQNQVGVVNAAGATQVGNVNAAGSTQVSAVQTKGTEVLNSIPADYTALSGEVSDLSSAFENHETRNLWENTDSYISMSYNISFVLDEGTYKITGVSGNKNTGVLLKGIDVSQYVGKRLYVSAKMLNASFPDTARIRLNTYNEATGEYGTQKTFSVSNDRISSGYFDVVNANSVLVVGLYSPTSNVSSPMYWEICDIQVELDSPSSYVDHTIKIQRAISPELFGAIGDGITDDSRAIQEFLNYSRSVIFPYGKTYLCSGLQVKDFHSINLNGCTLKTNTDAPIFITDSADDAVRNVHIFNGILSGDSVDKAKTNQILIHLSAFYSTFEDLYISNCYTGISLIPRTSGSDESTVENVFRNIKLVNCYNVGIDLDYLGSITDTRIDGLFANMPLGSFAAIKVGKAAGAIMSNLHLYGSPDKHISLRSASHTLLCNSYLEGSYVVAGLSAALTRNLLVSNVIILAGMAGSTMINIDELSGVTTDAVRHCSLTGITLEATADRGLNAVDSIIVGNNCKVTGANIVISDIYGTIKDPDSSAEITVIRLS